MHFLAGEQLWLLAMLPLLAAGYLWALRKRKQVVLSYPALSLVRRALAAGEQWRRHVPPTLLLLALAAMIIAGARPATTVLLPVDGRLVVLTMDVSGSMRAEDILPNRLEAAQAAAKAFVQTLPASTRVAVVAYAGSAHLVQAPTSSRREVHAAIDSFQLQRATAIGDGLIVALGTVFPLEGISVAGFVARPGSRPDAAPAQPAAHESGSYRQAAIVLLSDGQNTSGVDPIAAARYAAQRGVRVYTVGFGTPEGATIQAFGWTARVQLDEGTLQAIAQITGASYHCAQDAVELGDVYAQLREELVLEKSEREISALFANVAAALTLVAAALSVLWLGRVV